MIDGRTATMGLLVAAVLAGNVAAAEGPPSDRVRVEVFDGLPGEETWEFDPGSPSESFDESAFALPALPPRYRDGLRVDRPQPFLLRLSGRGRLPDGPGRLAVRSRWAARLFVDGEQVAEVPFRPDAHTGGQDPVYRIESILGPDALRVFPGDREAAVSWRGDGEEHEIRLDLIVGTKKLRPELGDLTVSFGLDGGDGFAILGPGEPIPLTLAGWEAFEARWWDELDGRNRRRRLDSDSAQRASWDDRHEWTRAVVLAEPGPEVPPAVVGMPARGAIDRFINRRLQAEGLRPSPSASDLEFLRRASLDVRGTPPSPEEVDAFLDDPAESRRDTAIDRLLDDPGWADHWVGYWQDVLAENPNLLNPTLNNTGPFRWWIFESFQDNKPMDRFADELIRMRGSPLDGGPAGFELATQNDVPMAAKAHIIAEAFLAVDLKCARCHDSPTNGYLQRDLFALAAMLGREPVKVPATSSVPIDEETAGRGLIEVTLKPGESVAPEWPFGDLFASEAPSGRADAPDADDPREQLAAMVTSPAEPRFAQVIVNRLWARLFGLGIVEPVGDWDMGTPSHPELLEWLARDFVAHGYDLKHTARRILRSEAYQRRSDPAAPEEAIALFAARRPRRMTAEQVVDSLFRAVGKPMGVEELNFDPAGTRPPTASINLGQPERAWQFIGLANERDRPSLTLAHAQAVVDLLDAFGWRGVRQDPTTDREDDPNVQQPAMIANGVLVNRLVQLTDDAALTELALADRPLDDLVDGLFLRLLSREPTDDERRFVADRLGPGFDARRRPDEPRVEPIRARVTGVSWSNHLDPEATPIALEQARLLMEGERVTRRLEAGWRERFEDVAWTLINSPEFVFVP